jgi:hypothetical protein
MKFKKQEKRTLIIGGIAVLIIALLWFFYLSDNSLYNRWSKLRSEVISREDVLSRMVRLRARYARLQQETGMVTNRLASPESSISLKGFLEKLIKEQAPTVDVRRMKSREENIQDLYRQTFLTVHLEKVTIPELLNILAAMESSPEGMKVQRLEIKLSRKVADKLDVDFTVVSARAI